MTLGERLTELQSIRLLITGGVELAAARGAETPAELRRSGHDSTQIIQGILNGPVDQPDQPINLLEEGESPAFPSPDPFISPALKECIGCGDSPQGHPALCLACQELPQEALLARWEARGYPQGPMDPSIPPAVICDRPECSKALPPHWPSPTCFDCRHDDANADPEEVVR